MSDGAAAKRRTGRTIRDVLRRWASDGPLFHEPTGLAELDSLTGGGPIYGSRWYVAGAPDAAKTLFLVQLAHTWARRGVTVGLLAVDEEEDDVVTRLAQRCGFSRGACELRDATDLAGIDAELGALPLNVYDASWTIEAAAVDLATLAKERAKADPQDHPFGPRAALLIDSIQTVQCAAELSAEREMHETAAITARTRAVRLAATRHRMITVATTELNRSAYRDPDQQTSIMATGKWSGAIEYAARVYLGLRSIKDEPDLVDVEIAKNKHGQRGQLFWQLNRRDQIMTEVIYNPPPANESAKESAKAAKFTATLDAVLSCIPAAPDHVTREGLLAALGQQGKGMDPKTLAPFLEALTSSGKVLDVGDGKPRRPRRYQRAGESTGRTVGSGEGTKGKFPTGLPTTPVSEESLTGVWGFSPPH